MLETTRRVSAGVIQQHVDIRVLFILTVSRCTRLVQGVCCPEERALLK